MLLVLDFFSMPPTPATCLPENETSEDEEKGLKASSSVLPSRGSVLHGSGLCKPCAWVWKPQGCLNGQACLRCHLCPAGEIKRRKKEPLKRADEESDEDQASGITPLLSPSMSMPPVPPPSRTAPLEFPLEASVPPVPRWESEPKGLELELMPQMEADILDAAIDEMPSVGSVLHGTGNCKPCAWFWKPQGCRNAAECGHCHLCPAGESKHRRQAKMAAWRAQNQVPEEPLSWRPPPGLEPHNVGTLASLGSADHGTDCLPCPASFTSMGCSKGAACELCHLCAIEAKAEAKERSPRKSCMFCGLPACSCPRIHTGVAECYQSQELSTQEVAAMSELPSLGSVLHAKGSCSPCAWVWKPQGCHNGRSCGRCHLCPPGEVKLRKKAKAWQVESGLLSSAQLLRSMKDRHLGTISDFPASSAGGNRGGLGDAKFTIKQGHRRIRRAMIRGAQQDDVPRAIGGKVRLEIVFAAPDGGSSTKAARLPKSGHLTGCNWGVVNSGSIYWYDLAVTVGGQCLVQPHSGRALAGRLLAVMGPSGAGKSLLLHSLAALAPAHANVTGRVCNGNGAEVGVPDGTMALLEQEVPFFSELTVRETVIFAARLEGRSACVSAADQLLKRLRLESVAQRRVGERYIGSSGQGLSGGEQRRLALACALAGEGNGAPRALLADEPTTGLDTFQAGDLVQLLADLGKARNCATLMTIHQPRSSVWAMIEDVLLLGPGGRCVFCGPTEDVLSHVGRLGYECPREKVNPADFLIDLISVHSDAGEAQKDHERISRLAEGQVQQGEAPKQKTSKTPRVRTPQGGKLLLLLRRAWLQISRDQATNLSRLGATAGLGFIFGAQFGHFDEEKLTAVSVTSRVGLLSFGAISMAFIGEMRALDRFAKEKKVVGRERAAGFYDGFTYLVAKAVAELPSDALFAALFAWVLHQRCGLRVPVTSLMAACALLAVVCAALGLAVGAAIPNADRAMIAGIPIMTVHMLTGVIDPAGAAAAQPSSAMVMLRSISPIRYAIEALCVRELEGAELEPSPGEAVPGLAGPGLGMSMEEIQQRLAAVEQALANAGKRGGEPRKAGGDAQVMKKVATRLQDFESQITAQLSNLQTDFDKKLSHVSRGAGSTKAADGAGGAAGLDTMAEDLDQLKYDVGELKDLLGNNKGEVNHIRRIVLACERDMEDFTAAMDAVNVDLDEMRARVDATHSIITSRQRVEATMTAEISTMRLDIGDIQEALKNHDSWMEDVSSTLQQMQEKEENLTEDIINLKNEMNTKLDTKVDNVAWKEANDDLDAAVKTVRDMVSSLRLDVDARRRKVDEILATIRHDITAVETNLEESKAKITSDTDQAVNALNGRIDFTNKDLAATQESLHTTQNSLSDCFNEVAVVRSDLERNVADTEARLKNDIRQKQQEAFEKIGAVEQQAELRSAEASRRLGALDLRMSGVQGGLGEHKRDILKLREEVNGLTVKSASHEVDIQKNSDATRKMEKQRNMDEQNWKAQMDAVHDVLDTKVNEKPFEDLKHCTAALTRGVVKFAQVVGVFPGPKFDDADGADQGEADVELLGWEECAENMSFRVDKAWRQRCSQRFRNILDMVAKKADHSVLRLLQISQQHIESQLERVKHERELWKEVVERRQQQPLQLALSMKAGKLGGVAFLRSGDVFIERLGITRSYEKSLQCLGLLLLFHLLLAAVLLAALQPRFQRARPPKRTLVLPS
ncbi:unnamed protein product [Effrenium voratum]|nr:unnamed protein product [Effrenium voratum]